MGFFSLTDLFEMKYVGFKWIGWFIFPKRKKNIFVKCSWTEGGF